MSAIWENIKYFWKKTLKEKPLKRKNFKENVYSQNSLLERDDTLCKKNIWGSLIVFSFSNFSNTLTSFVYFYCFLKFLLIPIAFL